MKNKKKIVLGIIVTIFLGAIGSGVWEYMLKPSFGFMSDLLLNITTLGVDSFKDDLYKTIAIGFKEDASLFNLNLLLIFFLIVSLSYIFDIKSKITIFKKIKPKEEKKIVLKKEDLKEEMNKLLLKEEDLKEEMKNLINKLRKVFYLFIMFIFIILIALYTSLFRFSYINNSIAVYEQLKKASRPYITEKEFLLIESNFSLIKNKKEYDSIIDKLENILKDNNLKIK